MDAEKKDTPRTDAFEKQRIVEATTNDIATEAWADFARQLERENERLREALHGVKLAIENDGIMIQCDNDLSRTAIQEALRWASQALAAQPEEKTK